MESLYFAVVNEKNLASKCREEESTALTVGSNK
jgi:hypothetical protein